MKRWIVPTLVAVAILAIGVLSALNSTDSSGDSDQTRDAAAHSRKHDDGKHDKSKNGDKAEKHDKADKRHGHGPQPWAHRHDFKHDKSARDMWKKLTPEERRSLMDRLIREHAEGMREWEECVAADRDDCVMPMPPGLAKRR